MKGTPTRHRCIYRLPDGRLFVRVTATIDGKKVFRRKVLPGGTSDADALRAVADLKDALAQQPTGSTRSRAETTRKPIPTLGGYATRWLAAKALRLRESVARETAHRLGAHVLPIEIDGVQLGAWPLDRVDRMAVDAWVAQAERSVQKSGKPYAADTVETWWNTFVQLLRDGCADHGLPDPTHRVSAPRMEQVPCVRTAGTLAPDKIDELLDTARLMVPDRYAELAFLALTGCRSGEAYGLHWDEVDLAGATVTLKYSATRAKLEPVKTRAPREVPLKPRLVAALQDHRQAQLEGTVPKSRSDLVFPAEGGGLRTHQSLAKPFEVLSAAIEQKVTPQVLRRSLNTNLVAAGVPLITIQAILGHCSDAMTKRYAGISMDSKAKALENLGAA